eukprot:TRINITY_DN6533_c2_g2_i1.p1 TRINITY_DN6533_c2_g2~~TRINITY_DN6533_c2_g2_i1.p1  ORF type:complete len:108 (-),score=8.60 TRINITY_DN6533_c2_g2_i1:887-1210(-)
MCTREGEEEGIFNVSFCIVGIFFSLLLLLLLSFYKHSVLLALCVGTRTKSYHTHKKEKKIRNLYDLRIDNQDENMQKRVPLISNTHYSIHTPVPLQKQEHVVYNNMN